MKKPIAWMLLSCIIALVMVLASCATTTETPDEGKTVTGQVTPTTPTSTTIPTTPSSTIKTTAPSASTVPVYGGTGVFSAASSPTQWDPGYLMHAPYSYVGMYEPLICGDWTKGPQGTNDFSFNNQTIPAAYLTGLLAEKVEIVDKYTIVYYLRKGIRFQNKPPANGREMVAADVVYAIQRTQDSPRSAAYKPPGTAPEKYVRAEALDKYTVKVTTPTAILSIGAGVQGYGAIYPPEAVKQYGNLEDWRNACGTGPWILTDFVPDSSSTYKKNPDYWRKDPLHPENTLPYMDGYRVIILPDEATRLAAIRTGKALMHGTTVDKAENIMANDPHLSYIVRPANYNVVIMWRNDKAPFNDIRVRKALNMAVDRATILKDFMKGKGILFAWPFYPWVGNDIYTPLEKLSPEIQEIWSYNPTKAKQLLTEAGLPNGFKVELIVQNVESYTDRAGIVKNYWDAIGVQTTVSVIETGTFYQRLYGKSYDSACLCAWGNTSEYSTVGWAWYTGRLYNYGVVSDKKIDEAYDKAIDEVDTAKRNAILREAGIYGMAQAWDLQLPAPYDYVFFQPWMKGYAGEFPDMFEGIQAHIWLDPVTQSQYKK